jgi:hypothetical protein
LRVVGDFFFGFATAFLASFAGETELTVAGAPSTGVDAGIKAGVVVSVSAAFFAIADFFMPDFFVADFFVADFFVAALFFAALARIEVAFFASAARFVFTVAARLAVAGFTLVGFTAALVALVALATVRVGSAEALLMLKTTVGSTSAPISDAARSPRRRRARLIF